MKMLALERISGMIDQKRRFSDSVLLLYRIFIFRRRVAKKRAFLSSNSNPSQEHVEKTRKRTIDFGRNCS